MHTKHLLIGFGSVIALLLIAATGVVLMQSRNTQPPVATVSPTPVMEDPDGMVACTMEAKLCPDGSAVGRTGPNCEFAPCPGESGSGSGTSSGSANTNGQNYRVLVQNDGLSGGLTEQKTEVVFTQQDLEALWSQIYESVEPKPPVPTVDFNRQAVIAAFSGTQPGGGNSIAVKSVEENAETVTITFKRTAPGQNCMTISAITKPYIIIALDNTGKQFITATETELRDCQ